MSKIHPVLCELSPSTNTLMKWKEYKLKRDTNQNFEKLTYNFKMREAWNNTCPNTTLNTRKKIVKIEIIAMAITQNVVERVCSNCTHGTSTFNVILNYALKHTFQLRGMASTLCMCTTVSPRQWQSWPLLGLKKDGIAVGLISGRNGVSKTLYSRGACKANWFKRQLHRRQVVAVGWETQSSSATACVWRWDQKKRLDYSNA